MSTMFEPHLTLSHERDGEFTLHSVTITSSSCFSAGPAERGAPPGLRLPAEVEPVLLHLRTRGEMCLWVPRPVQHSLPDLKLGKEHGKTTLAAFVMLGGSLLGSSSIDVTKEFGRVCVGRGGKDTPEPIETSEWYAWVDATPGAPRVLHVQGVVTMPTPGYDTALVPAAPQGFNPKILVVNLQITRRKGIFPNVVTSLPVRLEQPGSIGYEGVEVRVPDGAGVVLDVDEVR